MKSIYVTLFLIFFLYNKQLLTNELKYATTPYLKQHADNPVNWYEWGEKAFKKAQIENKPIFLSIGYSTCHWCHIMEKESFSNKKIAALLNRYFIAIKVDREELPQIDKLYQELYEKYYGHSGGWPLNVFMTPKKELFYITNYIPSVTQSQAEGFDTLLPKLYAIYEDKNRLKKKIQEFTKVKNAFDYKRGPLSVESLVRSLKKSYNFEFAGFGKSRQFPEASKLALMLDLAELLDDTGLEKNYFEMLDRMALRGLYDHVNGGFFRYSVDQEWEIPHFEKMLYTQAELLPLYVRGYLLRKKELYKELISETVTMLSDRFEKNALYLSASDADSQGVEGGYFTFTKAEIQKALENNPYAKDIEDAMEFSYEGNFYNDKVHINIYMDKRPKGFQRFQKELQKIAQKREYPFIDKKINTAWNAMMIEALYKASFIDERYAQKANEHLKALTQMMFDKGELHHQTLIGHKSEQKGLLEDYAFFIGALIAAYEVDFNEEHLAFAKYLLKQAEKKFYNEGIWYLSDDIYHVKADLNDKYYTSAQVKILQDIQRLAALEASFAYEKRVKESLEALVKELELKKADLPALARLYLMQKEGIVVIKSSQENLRKYRSFLQQTRYPYLLEKATDNDDYLACTLRECFAKESEPQKLVSVIEKWKR